MTARRRRIGKAKSARYAELAVRPGRSRRIYLRMHPRDIAYVKFCLESHDNLAYLSVVDKHAAVLKLVYAPGQDREVRQWLDSMHGEVEFAVVEP